MGHISFLQMLPTQQILRGPLDTFRSANALIRGYRLTREDKGPFGLGRPSFALFSKYLNSDILHNSFVSYNIHISSHMSHLQLVENFCVYIKIFSCVWVKGTHENFLTLKISQIMVGKFLSIIGAGLVNGSCAGTGNF